MNAPVYTINGEVKTMDTTAVVSAQGRTYVPLRFVAESLGAAVEVTTKTDGTSKITIVTADAVA